MWERPSSPKPPKEQAGRGPTRQHSALNILEATEENEVETEIEPPCHVKENQERHRSRDPETKTQAKEATKLGFGEEPR